MAFLNGKSGNKRSQLMVVDLGSRTTKALLVERRGDKLALLRYAMLDAPIFDKKISQELLADHLRGVAESLGNTTKNIALTVGLSEAVVRQIEMPSIPVDEMRLMLKTNSKSFLQQDYPNHVFDCHVFSKSSGPNSGDSGKTPSGSNRSKVLVAGARQTLVEDVIAAVKMAGLTADYLVPGMVGPVNAFEAAEPQAFATESVALVDIGFKQTSVCVLDRGDLALTRIVAIGGDQITAGLAEAMNISYAEAEGIKVGMAPEVQSTLEMQVMPLGRELRASLDFFEHQQDRPVSQVYVSGGSAQSEMILQILQAELIVECKTWNPLASLQLALPEAQGAEIGHLGTQLAVAVGAMHAAF